MMEFNVCGFFFMSSFGPPDSELPLHHHPLIPTSSSTSSINITMFSSVTKPGLINLFIFK